MLVLYRAEQGYESRTQLQLRRRGFFSLCIWTSYLRYEHHAVCAICNVITFFINILLTTTHHTLQIVKTTVHIEGKWLGLVHSWHAGTVCATLQPCFLNTGHTENKLNELAIHYRSHRVPHSRLARCLCLFTVSHVFLPSVLLIISSPCFHPCSPELPHVTLQSCAFVSPWGISGLDASCNAFIVKNAALLRVSVCVYMFAFGHWLYPAAQLNSNRRSSLTLQLRTLELSFRL